MKTSTVITIILFLLFSTFTPTITLASQIPKETFYKEFVVQTPTEFYDEPSFLKKTNDILYPSTVVVTEEHADGWKKIKTSTFEKWIAPEGIKYKLQQSVKQYFAPSFDEIEDGTISPQEVTVLDEQSDGWMKILTKNGIRWIIPEGATYNIQSHQMLYSTANFNDKIGKGIDPQTVKVIDFQQDGWFKIRTSMGDRWIAPNGVKYDLKQNVALYKEPSFLSEKETFGLMPQTVILLDEKPDGWKLIKTPYGNRWIAPDGISYNVGNNVNLYDSYYFSTTQGVLSPGIVTVIGEQPGGWYQIKNKKGIHWIAPNGVFYKITKNLSYRASNNILSPNIGSIPAGTIVKVVDDDKIWFNNRYVYTFLSYFSMNPVQPTSVIYDIQPPIYGTIGQINNIVTKGYDDEISQQILHNLSNIKMEIPDINISKISNIPEMNIPDMNITFDSQDFNNNMEKLKQNYKQFQNTMNNVNFSPAFDLMNKGMHQMVEGINKAKTNTQGMVQALNQANDGMQQMVKGLNQANSGTQQIIQGVNQANSGTQQMLNGIHNLQVDLKNTTNSVNYSVKEIKSIIDEPIYTTSSDLKTIHLDFDFSSLEDAFSAPHDETSLLQQQDEAMYNLFNLTPFTGNAISLGELLSGKNLNTGENLSQSDYALAILSVVGGGEIKEGAKFWDSLTNVIKRKKFTSTKIDLSWLEKFGDKYSAYEVTGTVKVGGVNKDISRRVYRLNNINWDYVAPLDVNPEGKSNLQLALEGAVPFSRNNTKIELHHLTQREPGSMIEIPAEKHDEFSKELHGIVEDGSSFRTDDVLEKQYNNFRKNYWKMRANEYLNGN